MAQLLGLPTQGVGDQVPLVGLPRSHLAATTVERYLGSRDDVRREIGDRLRDRIHHHRLDIRIGLDRVGIGAAGHANRTTLEPLRPPGPWSHLATGCCGLQASARRFLLSASEKPMTPQGGAL